MQVINEQDQDLIRRETGIPGFQVLLNPELLRARLLENPGIVDPGKLEAGYLRYKPGMNCIARYTFKKGDERHFAYAKAFGADAGVKLEKAREQGYLPGPLGPGRVVLERESILFSTFPNDSKLKSLAKLENPLTRGDLLDRLFKSRPGWGAVSIQLLNYKPERRLVAMLTNPSGDSATVKFYSGTEFSRVRHFRKHLRITENVKLPDWIGGSKAYRALAFSWFRGTTLREHLSPPDLELVRDAGRAIAHFHGGHQPRFKIRKPKLARRKFRALASELANLLPEQAASAMELAAAMTEWTLSLDDPALPVHGDFYDKQVVVGDGGVCLIDSDDAHLGDPLKDIAGFIAHLERNAVNHLMDEQDIAAVTDAFLDGYREVRPDQELRPLKQHIAVCLFQLIHNPFRDRVADWPGQTRTLLHKCEQLFKPAG